MASPASEALHQHIFNAVDPMCGSLQTHAVNAMSQNIAFLVKRAGGPRVSASAVSVSIIDVRDAEKCEIGHKATISIHQDQEQFRVVVSAQVSFGQSVMIGLNEKVESIIQDILEVEAENGNDGYYNDW